jgi:hypothetical protein
MSYLVKTAFRFRSTYVDTPSGREKRFFLKSAYSVLRNLQYIAKTHTNNKIKRMNATALILFRFW